jgi:predicted amidohydrolase YtcJ
MIAKSPLKQDEGDEWVRMGGVKMLVDGGFEGGHMSQPFAGEYGKGGTFYGLTVVPPQDFTVVVKAINDLGWRVATHAVGDAAIDEVLVLTRPPMPSIPSPASAGPSSTRSCRALSNCPG